MNSRILMAAFAASVLSLPAANAADLANRPARIVKPSAVGYCPASGQSAIARLPTLEAMRARTETLYAHSAATFESTQVQASRAVTVHWADLARITCGIAVGYLSTGEANEDRLNQCECNYARMKLF